MKSNKLIEAMNDIQDEYILEAKEKEEKKTFQMKLHLKQIGIVFACVCLFFIFLPRRNEKFSYSLAKTSDDMVQSEESLSVDKENVTSDSASNAKVIVYSNLSMETKDLDKAVENIDSVILKYEGIVQSSSISNYHDLRAYYVTIRVPKNKFDEFVKEVQKVANVTYYSKSQEDVTDTYNTSQARLDSLKQEEKRVLEFYEKASSVEELITVEQRLTEIQSEIHYLEDSIQNMDARIEYSTLSVDMSETSELTSNGGFIQRLQSALENGWHNFIWTLSEIIECIAYYWILIGIGCVVGIFWYRRKKK